jgi:WD40 repeat protein
MLSKSFLYPFVGLLLLIQIEVSHNLQAQAVYPDKIGGLAWNLNGTELAVLSNNGIFIYGRDGSLLRYQLEDIDYYSTLAAWNGWSPNGTRLLLGNRIVDAQTLQTLQDIQGPRGWLKGGQQVFSISADTISVYNTDDASLAGEIPVDIQMEEAFSSPDGTKIAATIVNGLFVFDVNQLTMIFQAVYPFRGIGRPIWSPDSAHIAFGGSSDLQDGTREVKLNVVDASTGDLLRSREVPEVGFLTWARQSNRLSGVNGYSNEIYIWDANTLDLLTTTPFSGEFTGYTAAFSPFGGVLAIGLVNSIDVGTGQSSALLEHSPPLNLLVMTPDVSIESLRTITSACGIPARTEAALDQQAATDLTAFTAQVAALPDTAIPPGCRADLLAVAAALQAQ